MTNFNYQFDLILGMHLPYFRDHKGLLKVLDSLQNDRGAGHSKIC